MWIYTLQIYSLSTPENTDENKIFFVCSPHHKHFGRAQHLVFWALWWHQLFSNRWPEPHWWTKHVYVDIYIYIYIKAVRRNLFYDGREDGGGGGWLKMSTAIGSQRQKIKKKDWVKCPKAVAQQSKFWPKYKWFKISYFEFFFWKKLLLVYNVFISVQKN